MTDTSIQAFKPGGGALSAESYQTFEMAKESDSVLGGDNIAQIRSYAAYARAQAQAIHKTIAATNGIDDVAAIKEEATETAQTFAKVGIYADQRIGEILRELPTRQGKRTDLTSVDTPTKVQIERDAGISHAVAVDLQAMAANPDVVQAVLDKAEAEGRIPSRKQVLDAIKERDEAEHDAAELRGKLSDLRDEVAALEKQNDQLYDQVQQAQEPKVITREVVPADYRSLKHERDLYLSDLQKLRKSNEDMRHELDRAKLLIGEKQRGESAQWDIAALTTATNNYLRQYGGKAWAFDQFYRVDEVTQSEFVKAINNLAAFAQNLAQMIKEQSNE